MTGALDGFETMCIKFLGGSPHPRDEIELQIPHPQDREPEQMPWGCPGRWALVELTDALKHDCRYIKGAKKSLNHTHISLP